MGSGWLHPDDDDEDDASADYDVDKLRSAIERESSDPTHRCRSCRTFDAEIESCPTKTYRWCGNCESVTRFIRLDSRKTDD